MCTPQQLAMEGLWTVDAFLPATRGILGYALIVPRLLVVDDDANLRESLRFALACEGYSVSVAEDGRGALQAVAATPPDLVVLDLQMPEMDGIEVCRRIREGSSLPVIMLTARQGVSSRVQGLDSGADDYLVKPFALEELLARIRALLRRRDPEARPRVHRYADLVLDENSREVRRGERRIELRPREFDLLQLLLANAGTVMSRHRLLAGVWSYPESSRVLDVYIGYLRTKLEAGGEARLLQTARGVGYVLRLEEEA